MMMTTKDKAAPVAKLRIRRLSRAKRAGSRDWAPEPDRLSREEIQRIVIDQIG
jgi:hypothetical protein